MNQWTAAEVAAQLGVKTATIHRYRTRGDIPAPDGYLGRTPWWHPHTIHTWQTSRPGQGAGGGRPRKDPQ